MRNWETTTAGGGESARAESEQISAAAGRPEDDSEEDLFAQREFQDLLRVICRSVYRRLGLGGRDPAYGPDDFYQDTFQKLLKSRGSFRRDNIPSAKAMFNLLYTATLNRGHSKLREIRRRRQWQVARETPDALPEGDSGVDLVREWAAQELMGFTESLPEERRRALLLKLEGHSFRKISKIFAGEGRKVSHVTVQKWYEASIRHVMARAS